MNVLLHTIALEPARWIPQRVSRLLAELIPVLAAAGFDQLEIYEPHLALAPDEASLAGQLAAHHLNPVVLSSYLELAVAANPADRFAAEAEALLDRVARFGFRKVRLFPGRSPSQAETAATVAGITERLQFLADSSPAVDFLLETHDGSLADDPACVVSMVEDCARPNIGLLWQPTVFAAEAARAQFALQRRLIHHCHLQNRNAAGRFTTLAAGVVPWEEFLSALPAAADVTLEFVPSGICPPDQFDLAASVAEAAQEIGYLRSLPPPR